MTTTLTERSDRPTVRRSTSVIGAITVAVAITIAIGAWLDRRLEMHIDAPPLMGRWSPRIGVALVLAIGVAAGVAWADRRTSNVPFGRLLVGCWVAAAAWGVSLALADGRHGLVMGILGRFEFLVNLDRIDGTRELVRTFVDRFDDFSLHARGHPPGTLVVLSWLDGVSLARPEIVAGGLIAAGASVVPAALITLRELVDTRAARRAAPFLVLAPAAIWLVTSFDALYAAVGAWGVCLLATAATRGGRTSDALAVAGGVVLGIGIFLTYGLVVIAAIPLIVLAWHRRIRALVLAMAGGATVVVTFAALGFWWLAGLEATRREYFDGVGSVRPYAYFVFANLLAFAIAVGPGPLRGYAVLRDRKMWILCGAAVAAVLVADLSGLSKGEVERIWLPFWPFVAVAASAIPGAERTRWLAAQAGVAIAVQTLLYIPW